MKKGTLIALEGMDCSGKSSNVKFLEELLTARGYAVITTREPGGTVMAEEIRNSLIKPRKEQVLPLTEVLLFAASRHQHTETLIKPALEEGYIVITDRYTDSSFAYQAMARGLMREFRTVEEMVLGDFRPDHVLHFKVSLETALERQRRRSDKNDRLDQEGIEFKKKVLDGYLARSNIFANTYVDIDAEDTIESVREKLTTWVWNNYPDINNTDEGKHHLALRWNAAIDAKIAESPLPVDPTPDYPASIDVTLFEFPRDYSVDDANTVFANMVKGLGRRIATLYSEYNRPVRQSDQSMDAWGQRMRCVDADRICLHIKSLKIGLSKDGRSVITAKAKPYGPYASMAVEYLALLTDTARPLFYRAFSSEPNYDIDERGERMLRSDPRRLKNLMIVSWDLISLPPLDDEGRPNYR
jgi:dTMP kinase